MRISIDLNMNDNGSSMVVKQIYNNKDYEVNKQKVFIQKSLKAFRKSSLVY